MREHFRNSGLTQGGVMYLVKGEFQFSWTQSLG